MLPKAYQQTSSAALRIFLLLSLVCCAFVVSANAQNVEGKKVSAKTEEPAWHSYKDVHIGMTDKEVRDRLGSPKSEDTEGYFYMVSDTETAQVLFDGAKKVRTISIVYSSEHPSCPKYAEVFGPNVAVEPKPDGAVYKLVRYQELGYWVSFNRTAGDKPMVIITIQKF